MSNICQQLHDWCAKQKKHGFPFNEKELPLNGVYLLFEKGEKRHGTDRIVRVGTHTGHHQLRSRLQQHFLMENKDRSIFRKNIGRALLKKENNSFLKTWELDLTTKEAKGKYAIDAEQQRTIEKKVTCYIQNNFTFIVIPVEEKEKRLALESKCISTVSLCEDCHSSSTWLGLHSPKQKIRESGMWQVNELYKKPLSEKELMSIFKNTP
ncbi:hypothetical protein C4573_03365 [Candidatus Woesearchaeota archaeon]|nr:MAG: hypothetical protein C4573_03365 [Candidatus Woesearchaeota archaeon]